MVKGSDAGDDVDDRELLSDRIRNALTDEIAAGTLVAGASLDEQQLADRFGASRTPVREALRQLAVSGLVEVRARRGVVVARLTAERIMDMFETSAEIEAMCVRLATYRMTPLERSHLIGLHDMISTRLSRKVILTRMMLSTANSMRRSIALPTTAFLPIKRWRCARG